MRLCSGARGLPGCAVLDEAGGDQLTGTKTKAKYRDLSTAQMDGETVHCFGRDDVCCWSQRRTGNNKSFACYLTSAPTLATCGVTILLVSFRAAMASSYRPAMELARMRDMSWSIFMPSFR